MARLDKSRPYTQVYGIADHAFGQDGKLFDLDGNQVGGEPEAAKPELVKAKAKAAKPESDQVDQQLNG